jgi:hypothetical protein
MPRAARPLAQRAGILCSDPEFRAFLRAMAWDHDPADYVRTWCRVDSRRDLDTTPDAATRFAALLTDFDAWRGRVAAQR